MTTIDMTVAASADDAHEDSTGANFSSTATTVNCTAHTSPGTANRQYNGGFRFVLSAQIPSGATIDASYITVTPTSLALDDANVNIYAEQASDAVNFSTNADVTSRTGTTASVAWVQDALGTSAVNSPSLNTVIQELVNDYGGLANGAAIVILLKGKTDAIKSFQVFSEDHASGAPASLHIEFTASGTTYNQSVSGTLNLDGNLTKRTGKIVAGTLTSDGNLTKRTNKPVSGSLTPDGSLVKRTNKVVSGVLTTAGDITKQVGKVLSGTLMTAGDITKRTSRSLSGAITPDGSLAKQTNKLLSGTLTSTGDITKRVGKTLSGVLATSGEITKRTTKLLSGTLTTAGDVATSLIGQVTTAVTLHLKNRTNTLVLGIRTAVLHIKDRVTSLTLPDNDR